MHRIFVYGSLRTGKHNHEQILRAARRGGARFEGFARTEARYDLVDLGPYPAMLREGPLAVAGEVFHVDDRALEELDRFEGHPHLYVRTEVRLEDGSAAWAWVFARPTRAPRIEQGEWRP